MVARLLLGAGGAAADDAKQFGADGKKK